MGRRELTLGRSESVSIWHVPCGLLVVSVTFASSDAGRENTCEYEHVHLMFLHGRVVVIARWVNG
jgi:hypothetical protein